MGNQQLSAPSRASSRHHDAVPRSGVIHVNARHTRRFTVVGNHLAQHAEMSLVAIGLALHIQSLPTGAHIGIKDLAPRFPESEYRIARALRELEEHGYLRRTRVRLDNGQVVTRTVSYNRPGCGSEDGQPGTEAPELVPVPEPVPDAAPDAVTPVKAIPPLPRPRDPDRPARRAAAERILVELRAVDSRLLLGARDVERLAPAVEAWLERGATPEAVIAALTDRLPPRPRSAAGLVAYRLTEQLPPERVRAPGAPGAGAAALEPGPEPMQNCEYCDRAYRGPEPGCCDGCRTSVPTYA
ncbi:helix-turn-helix domain-containing protein [Streptomyces sp. NBC_00536]|uniref:helix-turn-helix domain-containing protein n=1 Tax=Streptomyces sp. NBC_00536 TaxID=2975769 RepID=UPI002E803F6B|nr:helix-turn-helix domain-containing protein [Streptomyces sp. NBC_00536]WUC80654.1 helix-turn-helix domain-containing protein [Streptomyces sp. NBC_00536]